MTALNSGDDRIPVESPFIILNLEENENLVLLNELPTDSLFENEPNVNVAPSSGANALQEDYCSQCGVMYSWPEYERFLIGMCPHSICRNCISLVVVNGCILCTEISSSENGDSFPSGGEREGIRENAENAKEAHGLEHCSSENSDASTLHLPEEVLPPTSATVVEVAAVNDNEEDCSSKYCHDDEGPQGEDRDPDEIDRNLLSATGEIVLTTSEDNEDNRSHNGEQEEQSSSMSTRRKHTPVIIPSHVTVLKRESGHAIYNCNVCQRKFKTKGHVRYHEFCATTKKRFRYNCAQCERGFNVKCHYEYHLQTHSGEKPYICSICKKGFLQSSKLKRHMITHTGERPYLCPQCGRGFAYAAALKCHLLIHTGDKPFACLQCFRRFRSMAYLKKHAVTHTTLRPFTCSVCDKSFRFKFCLERHMKTHSGERPFLCDQCPGSFINSKDLLRHLFIHSGERPFICEFCGKNFRRKDNFNRHVRENHQKN